MPTSRTLSAQGLTFLRMNEQFSATKYPDPPGQSANWGIGYGHQWRPGDPDTVTMLQAVTMLLDELRVYVQCVNAHVAVEITQAQFDALVDFTYNEGCGALIGSTLLRLLNAGDYHGAAEQFLVWDKDQFGINAGLLARRKLEKAMFQGPPATDDPADIT